MSDSPQCDSPQSDLPQPREPSWSSLAFERSLASLAVLIPAWQPEATLAALVAELQRYGFGLLVVVDDGSSPTCRPIFSQAAAQPGVEVLQHAKNCGKGRALKTGFNHLLNMHPQLMGVVTADADGQHTADDIERVARALQVGCGRSVFGARRFEGEVPFRSRFGNLLMRKVFGWLTGVKLCDTQTGLRGFPFAMLPELLALEGERYEYEMTVLAHLCRSGRAPLEIPIATVYLENNQGSRFRPVRDSMRIGFVLLRSPASFVLSAGVGVAGLFFLLRRRRLGSSVSLRLPSAVRPRQGCSLRVENRA